MWHASSATPVCFIWNGRGCAPVWATKKHRDTAHKQKTVSGDGVLPPAQHKTLPAPAWDFVQLRLSHSRRWRPFPLSSLCWVHTSLQGRCNCSAGQLSLRALVQRVSSGHLQKCSFGGKRKAWIQPHNSGTCGPLLSIGRSHQPRDPDTSLWGSSPHPGRASAGPGAVTRCWHLQRFIPPATCVRNLG